MSTIVLIGYRGAGKTTLGRWLAASLNQVFVDTDDVILEELGYETVTAAWNALGECGWREAEARIIPALLCADGVIALGGGAPMLKEVRNALEGVPTIIHLYASPEVTTARITAGCDRPALASTDLATRAARFPTYTQLGTHEVDTSGAMDLVKAAMMEIMQKAHLR